MAGATQGTQVVSVLEDHSYRLDEKLLEQLLLKEEVRDLPVVVVSVAGAYRGGKSFLLNFFLRYLSSPASSQQDGSWLRENSESLAGFNWRGGMERNTTGILLWSEPFITTLASGERVAVLLMDTQGTFDSKSTVRDNSTIFALSTLLSSVQIYNLSMNIQEDDLQYLQLFTMYGNMVQEKNIGGKAFQTLGFLVRDWPYPYDCPFGADGGSQLMQERLKITADQPEEIRELRNHLRSSYEKVFCFLMPHPGFKVQDPNFKGNINDIEPNFTKHLIELVTSLLSPTKLRPKTINGQRIKVGDLCNYFKAYMTVFNSDKIPNPKSIVQATVEAGLLSALNEARELYEDGMNAECGPSQPCVPSAQLLDLHRKYLDAARENFTNKITMASLAEVNDSLDRLMKDLESRFPQYEQSNLSKLQGTIKQANDLYENMMSKYNKNQHLCLHPLDLEELHNEAVQACLQIYDAQVKSISDKPDPNLAELKQNCQNRYLVLMMSNDHNNKAVVKELFMQYQNIMGTKSTNPPLSATDYKKVHDAQLGAALEKFQSKRNRSKSYPQDIYREELEKTIMNTFWQLETINQGKIEQERNRLEEERIRAAAEQARVEHEIRLREQETARLNQENEKMELEKQRLEQERQRLEIENQSLRNRPRSSSPLCTIALGLISRVANAAITKALKE